MGEMGNRVLLDKFSYSQSQIIRHWVGKYVWIISLENKDLCILQSLDHGRWLSGHAKSQNICNRVIDLVFPKKIVSWPIEI